MNANGNADFGTSSTNADQRALQDIATADSLTELLRAISDGACWLFSDGRLLPLNERWFVLHGGRTEQPFPSHLSGYEQHYLPSTGERANPLRAALAGERFRDRPQRIDLPWLPEGQRQLLWSTALTREEGTCLLVREQRETPDGVQAERFRLALEAFPSAMVMLDREGRIVLSNPQTTHLFGYAQHSLVGESIERIVPSEGARPHPMLGVKELNSPQSPERPTELSGMHRDGHHIPILVGLNRVTLDREEFILCAFTDNSARKRAEENIRRVNEQLWRKHQEMEQFVYSVSHDLKSPLVTVTGFVGMLKEDLAAGHPEAATDSVTRIERATRRMSALINDLLQLSRIGRVEIERQTVSLEEVIGDLEQDLADRFRDAQAHLRIETALPSVSADRAQVVEVFDNLLSNALKYGCPEPGATITLGANATADEVQIYVQDQGPGVPAAYQEKIFQAFQRLSNQTDGTGVGLAIVEKIMRTHGGRVWLESPDGQGARFWVAFPERPM